MNEKSKSAGSNITGDGSDEAGDKQVPGATGRQRRGPGSKPDTTLQGAPEKSRNSESPEKRPMIRPEEP